MFIRAMFIHIECTYLAEERTTLLKRNRGSFILNQVSYYKLRQIHYKSWQLLLLQIGAIITNRGNYYKSGQLLQIWAQHV